jgi:phage terminase small subunit
MAAGRKKLPDQMKVVKGTFRKGRSVSVADRQSPDGMTAPEWLPEPCLSYFERLRGLVALVGLDSDSYSILLAQAAMRLAEIDACNRDIAVHGRVTRGDSFARTNPAVSQLNEATRHLQSLLAEFGLTPSSIGKIQVKRKEADKNQGFGGL